MQFASLTSQRGKPAKREAWKTEPMPARCGYESRLVRFRQGFIQVVDTLFELFPIVIQTSH